MDNKQLHQSLQQLHAELGNAETLDDESRQLLEQLRRDIQAVMKESTPEARQSLRDRLDAAMAHFEDSHPGLTLTLKQVIDNLAQI